MTRFPLFDKQDDSGALFAEPFGWQVPRPYLDIAEEYFSARNAAVMMKRSYFGHLHITGNDHVDLLHRLTTNELRTLKPGEGQINIFANEKGRIIDRVILQAFSDSILLTTSPGNAERVAEWIEKYIFIEDVKVENLATALTTLSLFGPVSATILNGFFSGDFTSLQTCHHNKIDWRGNTIIVSSSDELGIPGFDLIVATGHAHQLWDELFASGRQFDLKPMGDAAYDVLRIEAGWPIYGRDFDEEINPHEAGMSSNIDFNKGCYIGQEVIARLDTYDKVQKHLMGVIFEGDALPKFRDPIFMEGLEVGYLTSVGYSFGMQKSLALGYVRTKFAIAGGEVQAGSDDNQRCGHLVKLPFKIATPV